jgi:hemolysin III
VSRRTSKAARAEPICGSNAEADDALWPGDAMDPRRLFEERPTTRAEEIANALSHGAGLLVSAVALPLLVAGAMRRGPWSGAGAIVFAATVVILYLASTAYHATTGPRARRILQRVDHAAIYLLIAGTYTPFLLGPLRGAWGWTLLAAVWTIAAAGLVLKSLGRLTHRGRSLALYLGMGWLAVVAIVPLWRALPAEALLWLAAGGLAYTGGVLFFALERMRFGHLVWHGCVLAGTACHYVAVLRYAG